MNVYSRVELTGAPCWPLAHSLEALWFEHPFTHYLCLACDYEQFPAMVAVLIWLCLPVVCCTGGFPYQVSDSLYTPVTLSREHSLGDGSAGSVFDNSLPSSNEPVSPSHILSDTIILARLNHDHGITTNNDTTIPYKRSVHSYLGTV